jgi:hypothetical protein
MSVAAIARGETLGGCGHLLSRHLCLNYVNSTSVNNSCMYATTMRSDKTYKSTMKRYKAIVVCKLNIVHRHSACEAHIYVNIDQ